jgi:hypothetical protein
MLVKYLAEQLLGDDFRGNRLIKEAPPVPREALHR